MAEQLPPIPSALPKPLNGLKVKLARDIDKIKPCCSNLAVIRPGKGPHIGQLRCACCDRQRGWLSKATADWLLAVIEQFGRPTEPLSIATTNRGGKEKINAKGQ
jgi:hypothetical protein